MKILLLGEFSALHKNLKEGLQSLGHYAVIAGTSDGYKKITTDISFGSSFPSFLGVLDRKLKPFLSLPKLKNFDVVQLINPFVIYGHYFSLNRLFYDNIIKNNNKFFLLGAGDDAYYWKYGRKMVRYCHIEDFLKYDNKSPYYYMNSPAAFSFNKRLLEKSNGIIPTVYEYEVSYLNCPKRLETIPFPINIEKIEYTDNICGKKITIFHGLNRYGSKGTRHVEEAFAALKKKYPNDLELITDGQLPLKEYLEIMKKTNVVVDQMYGYSTGMNGVYALAMGKIVMGGAEPEAFQSLKINSSPVINLQPNAASIVKEVEKLLEKRSEIQEMGYQSRLFAENVHGHIKVAKQYLDTWNKH